jgi:hypothetical protein
MKKMICFLLILTTFMSLPIMATDRVDLPKTEAMMLNKSIYNDSLVYVEIERSEMPLYNQKDYPNVPYGKYGTISTHGCGPTCLAMVATYLLDEVYMPDQIGNMFGEYNYPSGSAWSLFRDSAEVLGLDLELETSDFSEVRKALANGQVVVSLQKSGYFTDGGHYIVLKGLNQDDKILVNDPYGGNYTRTHVLIEGFANGFENRHITAGGIRYWIYAPKQTKLEKALSSINENTTK